MLEVCAIASGSNGNCYYVGNHSNAVLIDAGISHRQLIKRMNEKGLDSGKIKAVFISHEHSDHIRGVRVLSKKLNVPVYITAKTYMASYKNMQPDNPRFFEAGDIIEAGELRVHTFIKNHDASEPCSFRVEYNGKNVGILTDIGEPCNNVTSHLNLCNVVFLESNYDEKMLQNGSYPYFLKERVASSQGHLSNVQAFELLDKHAGKHLKCVFLSHLSADNNTPELAFETHSPLMHRFDVKLTFRTGPAEVCVL